MASGAVSASEQKLAAAHKALLQTRGLQFDFKSVPAPPPTPPWLKDLLDALSQFGPIFRFLFWAGVALAVALIIWFVVREAMSTRLRARPAAGPRNDWRPEPEKARALLEAADRLAAEGRFGDAIHLLLFRSIDDLASRRPGLVHPALTSRDIADLEQMPANARGAFGRIAQRVEMSFFGGRESGPDDFAGARGDYEAFAFAEDWA